MGEAVEVMVGSFREKLRLKSKHCWRVAQCRGGRSQKCVCVVSEVLGLMLVG